MSDLPEEVNPVREVLARLCADPLRKYREVYPESYVVADMLFPAVALVDYKTGVIIKNMRGENSGEVLTSDSLNLVAIEIDMLIALIDTKPRMLLSNFANCFFSRMTINNQANYLSEKGLGHYGKIKTYAGASMR